MNEKEIADLFQEHREELGFVNRAQVAEHIDNDEIVVEERDGGVVGALLYHNCIQKPQTTVYEIAVAEAYRRLGIASVMLAEVAEQSPHDKLVAKCPVDLPANELYRAREWELETVEEGKNRHLNVWKKYP
jgi:ribosomal protein S18 acetylase RimI-like enzyme